MTLTTKKRKTLSRYSMMLCAFTLLFAGFSGTSYAFSSFDQAMQHAEKEEWAEAKTLLEYHLLVSPEHHRAKLELAMVYIRLEMFDKAHTQLTSLLSVEQLPANVKYNIELTLEQVNDELARLSSSASPDNPSKWAFESDLSYGHDSNVRFNFGDYFLEDDPYTAGAYIKITDELIVFYSPDGNIYDQNNNLVSPDLLNIDLGPRNQDTDYIEGKFSAEHSYQFNNLNWSNKLLLQNTDYTKFSSFDKQLIKFQSIFTHQLSATTEYTIGYEYRDLKRGGSLLLNSEAVNLGYNWLMSVGSLGFYVKYMDRKFYDSKTERGNVITTFYGFENETYTYGLKWSKLFFSQRLLGQINIEKSDNEASDGLEYEGLTTKLALVYRLTDKWSLATYYSKFTQEYDSKNSNIVDMDDVSTRYGAKTDYQFAPNKEIYLILDKGSRDSDIYGDIASEKTDIKLGIKITF